MLRRTLVLSISLALGATAQSALAQDATPTASEAPVATTGTRVPKALRAPECTGTRIRPAAGQPCPAPTSLLRSYSQNDLQRTGQIQIGDALRLLDPIFR